MSQPSPNALTDDQQRQFITDLTAAVQKIAPDWTSHQGSDPGITVLELFAWLSENLLYRTDPARGKKADLLNQIIAGLVALRPGAGISADLTRPRYFDGQLLTASDFEDEQTYTRNMMKRHNRCVVGCGIVSGLAVTADVGACTNDDPVITVRPGCAVDRDGQQLTVCEPLRCTLHATGSVGYVVIQYCERPIDPVPVLEGPAQYSRIEEGVAVSFETQPLAQGVAIARLKRKAARWTLDRHFRPQKCERGR